MNLCFEIGTMTMLMLMMRVNACLVSSRVGVGWLVGCCFGGVDKSGRSFSSEEYYFRLKFSQSRG